GSVETSSVFESLQAMHSVVEAQVTPANCRSLPRGGETPVQVGVGAVGSLELSSRSVSWITHRLADGHEMPSNAAPPSTPETNRWTPPTVVTIVPLTPTDRQRIAVGQATPRRMLGVDSGARWSTSRGVPHRTGAVLAGAADASTKAPVTATNAHSARIMTVAL